MSEADQKKREDDVLRRMLATPPSPYKPMKRTNSNSSLAQSKGQQ